MSRFSFASSWNMTTTESVATMKNPGNIQTCITQSRNIFYGELDLSLNGPKFKGACGITHTLTGTIFPTWFRNGYFVRKPVKNSAKQSNYPSYMLPKAFKRSSKQRVNVRQLQVVIRYLSKSYRLEAKETAKPIYKSTDHIFLACFWLRSLFKRCKTAISVCSETEHLKHTSVWSVVGVPGSAMDAHTDCLPECIKMFAHLQEYMVRKTEKVNWTSLAHFSVKSNTKYLHSWLNPMPSFD